jgi:predicted DNA binding CopG/RHH family protein
MVKLMKAERELLTAVERGEWRSVKNLEKERARYQGYARATLRKDRRINIRLSQKDLEALQTLALEEGLPYQTLIASILHKYVAGSLVERRRLAMSQR